MMDIKKLEAKHKGAQDLLKEFYSLQSSKSKPKEKKKDDLKDFKNKTIKELGLIGTILERNNASIESLNEKVHEQKEQKQPRDDKANKSNLTVVSSMKIIASSLRRINVLLEKAIKPAELTGAVASIPNLAPTGGKVEKEKSDKGKEGGFFSILKELFTNPVVATAIAYAILPKEITDKVLKYLGLFNEGMNEAIGEREGKGLKGLTRAIETAKLLLEVYFGAKIISAVASAVIKVVQLVKWLNVKGKVFGKAISKLGPVGAIVGTGLAAVGAAAVISKPEEDETTNIPETKPEPTPPPMQSGESPEAVPVEKASPATTVSPSATTKGEIKGVGETGSAREAIDFFVSKGWSNEQAAGIVGNLQAESGGSMRTDAVGDNGKAYGIAQWHPDRQERFKQVFGKDIRQAGFKEQLEFVNWELNNSERNAGNLLRGATSAGEAAAIFDKYYERSSGGAVLQRIANANALAGGTSTMAAVPVPTAPNRGAEISSITQSNKQAVTARKTPEVSTLVSNDTTAKMDPSRNALYDPIPSPIANRGSLGSSVSHTTAYA